MGARCRPVWSGRPGQVRLLRLPLRPWPTAGSAGIDSANSGSGSANSGSADAEGAPGSGSGSPDPEIHPGILPEALPENPPEVLSGYLTEQTVKVQLDASGKEAAIREMAGLLARTGKVVDVEELVATALRREAQGTTGLGEEIAIPHAKTDAVSAPVVGFARSAEGSSGAPWTVRRPGWCS